MAHHQHGAHDRAHTIQDLSVSCIRGSSCGLTLDEEDPTSEPDEPPESVMHFTKVLTPSVQSFNSRSGLDGTAWPDITRDRKASLLTQALLSSPELHSLSDAEAPVLTSDGGLTSPARTTTPSPPTPTLHHRSTAKFGTDIKSDTMAGVKGDALGLTSGTGTDGPQENTVEAGLGRRRCISFACGRLPSSQKTEERPMKKEETPGSLTKALDPPKRRCLLKFACPMKPARTESYDSVRRAKSPSPKQHSSLSVKADNIEIASVSGSRPHQDPEPMIENSPTQSIPTARPASQSRKGTIFNRVDFQKSEATRFHEFAGPFNAEDEWTNEQTAYRHKLTVNDTLRKENAIRELAQEAEDEALEEEDEDGVIDEDERDNDMQNDDDDEVSNDGNESDDEEGFADSDDESDDGSDYHFWTPGLTTAATSTDHLEHIRPLNNRVASNSSIESIINVKKTGKASVRSPHLRPGTPELPNDSDFVVGTIDEDRPLEEAYASCLEERRRSKHKVIPQDIDPSFPTSEPEDDVDEEDEADSPAVDEWMTGRPGSWRNSASLPWRHKSSSTAVKRCPVSSPKRLHSPPPKRSTMCRSPPPRRLFGQAVHRLRSPPPTHRKLTSPPSSRRPSLSGSLSKMIPAIPMLHLAQRPNLTHTTSLPKTPNPFWLQHRARFHDSNSPSTGTSPKSASQSHIDVHSRGPIDIVQGLETKRQRRKDKFWRQHCRTAGKDKGRRCQPGKGAERMKELGLEMADRFRGYGQKVELILSL